MTGVPSLPRPRRPALDNPVPSPETIGPLPVNCAQDFAAEALRELWDLLEAKRGARALLSRADIEPSDLRPVLPRVGLIEVHEVSDAPLRFRFRLAGTQWADDLGFDPTGMWLHDWPHETQRQMFERSLNLTIEARAAMRTQRHAVIDGIKLLFEAMIVPLAQDGETINMVLSLSAPYRTDIRPTTVLGQP